MGIRKRLKYIRTANSRSEKINLFWLFKVIRNMKFVYKGHEFWYKGYYVSTFALRMRFDNVQKNRVNVNKALSLTFENISINILKIGSKSVRIHRRYNFWKSKGKISLRIFLCYVKSFDKILLNLFYHKLATKELIWWLQRLLVKLS